MLCNNLNGKMVWKRIDTFIYITESLCCKPEINTTLPVNYGSGDGSVLSDSL